MQDEPTRDERIVEAIEACRPDSGDIADPALALLAERLAADPELDELYERCQQLDARVASAFHDVPVPEGLANRILARIGTSIDPAAAAIQADAVPATDQPPVAQPAPDASPREKRTRRRWFAGAAVAAGLAASIIIGVMHFPHATPMSQERLLELAIDFFSHDEAHSGDVLTDENQPEEFPFSRHVNLFPGARFRTVSGFAAGEGVAYDMTNRMGVEATLYVFKSDEIDVAGLPSTPPPFRVAFRTRGCSSAAWQSDGLLYVLVISGDSKQTYDSFLPIPGPVT